MHRQLHFIHVTPLLPGKCETIPGRLDATEEEFDFGAGQLASTDKGFDSEMLFETTGAEHDCEMCLTGTTAEGHASEMCLGATEERHD